MLLGKNTLFAHRLANADIVVDFNGTNFDLNLLTASGIPQLQDPSFDELEIGHHYTGHDLRRTFVTVAEALDISDYTLKRLIGHKVDNAQDVTAGYVISSNDRLRKAAQLISNAIMNTGTAPTTTEI